MHGLLLSFISTYEFRSVGTLVKSLVITLRRAVEHFARCLAKQAVKV